MTRHNEEERRARTVLRNCNSGYGLAVSIRSVVASVRAPTWCALGIGAVKLILQLTALQPYGYFRDELYYLACSHHLAFGYVDHPPFSIAVLAGWRALLGDSVTAIRLLPAIAGAALVVVTGRLTMSLGGGVTAVALASLAVLCAPALVAVDHLYSMNALDHLFWAGAALCAVRLLESAEVGASVIERPPTPPQTTACSTWADLWPRLKHYE